MIERRALGKSSVSVTPVGLGCWQFSRGAGPAGRPAAVSLSFDDGWPSQRTTLPRLIT